VSQIFKTMPKSEYSRRQAAYERAADRNMEFYSAPPKQSGNNSKDIPQIASADHVEKYLRTVLTPHEVTAPVPCPCVQTPPCSSATFRDYVDILCMPTRASDVAGGIGAVPSLFQRGAVLLPSAAQNDMAYLHYTTSQGITATDTTATRKDASFDLFRGHASSQLIMAKTKTELNAINSASDLGRVTGMSVRFSALGAPSTQTGTLHVYRPSSRVKLDMNATSQTNIIDSNSEPHRLVSIPISKLGRDGPHTFTWHPLFPDDYSFKIQATLSNSITDPVTGENEAGNYLGGSGYVAAACPWLFFFIERAQGVDVGTASSSTVNEVIRIETTMHYDYIKGPTFNTGSANAGSIAARHWVPYAPGCTNAILLGHKYETSTTDPSNFDKRGPGAKALSALGLDGKGRLSKKNVSDRDLKKAFGKKLPFKLSGLNNRGYF